MKNYEKILSILPSGFGHKKITVRYYDHKITGITNNMPDVDLFKSEKRGWKSAGNRLYRSVVFQQG